MISVCHATYVDMTFDENEIELNYDKLQDDA